MDTFYCHQHPIKLTDFKYHIFQFHILCAYGFYFPAEILYLFIHYKPVLLSTLEHRNNRYFKVLLWD